MRIAKFVGLPKIVAFIFLPSFLLRVWNSALIKSNLAHAIIDDKLTTICAFFEAGVFYARNQNYTTGTVAWQKRGVPAELQTTHIFNKYCHQISNCMQNSSYFLNHDVGNCKGVLNCMKVLSVCA